jgi:hypothetical protein
MTTNHRLLLAARPAGIPGPMISISGENTGKLVVRVAGGLTDDTGGNDAM